MQEAGDTQGDSQEMTGKLCLCIAVLFTGSAITLFLPFSYHRTLK